MGFPWGFKSLLSHQNERLSGFPGSLFCGLFNSKRKSRPVGRLLLLKVVINLEVVLEVHADEHVMAEVGELAILAESSLASVEVGNLGLNRETAHDGDY